MGKDKVVLILLLVLIVGCAKEIENEETTQKQNVGVSDMGKVLFIVAQNNFRDEELEIPKQELEGAGYPVEVASIEKKAARGMLGKIVVPDLTVKDALQKVNDYGLIVVVGGSGAPSLAEHKEVLDLLRLADKKGKNLAAICLGPVVLAKAGVLKGKQATVFRTEQSLKALKEGNASYVSDDVVVDSRLVTADGPAAAKEFSSELIKLLK